MVGEFYSARFATAGDEEGEQQQDCAPSGEEAGDTGHGI